MGAQGLVRDDRAQGVGHHDPGVGTDGGLHPGLRGEAEGRLLEVGGGLGQQPVEVVLGQQLGQLGQVDVGVHPLDQLLDGGDGGGRVHRRLVPVFGVPAEHVAVEGHRHVALFDDHPVPGQAVGEGREPP